VQRASGDWLCGNVRDADQEPGASQHFMGRIFESLNASSKYSEHGLKGTNLPLGSEVN
jgi:hypothetical protein